MLHRESQRRRETPLRLRMNAEGILEVVAGARVVQRVSTACRGPVERIVGSTQAEGAANASVRGFTREPACALQDRMKWLEPPDREGDLAA